MLIFVIYIAPFATLEICVGLKKRVKKLISAGLDHDKI
jgi:hypothetical protein